jgi:PPP family 3-phenylpropionic acid transporter
VAEGPLPVTMLAAVVRERSTARVVATGLYIAAFAAVGASLPYIPVFFQSIGLSLDAIGLVAAVSALGALVSAPTWGALADRALGVRGSIAAATGVSAIGAVLLPIASSAAIAVPAWILYQISYAGVTPVLDSFALDQVGEDRHRYARFRVWGSASFVFSVVGVGLLIQLTEIRAMFIVLLGCLAAAILLALMVSRSGKAHAERSYAGLRVVLASRPLMAFVFAMLVVFSASTMVNSFYSIYLVSLGTPAGLVGSAWAIGALVEVPTMLAFPALASRVGVNRLLVVGALAMLLRVLVVFFATDPLIAVAAMALHGLGFALLLVGGVTYVASLAPPRTAATAQGVLAGVVFGLAAAVGPGIGGLIAGASSVHSMFAFAAAGSAAGLIAIFATAFLSRRRRLAALATEP